MNQLIRLSADALAARWIVVATSLSLNDVGSRVFGIGQLVSVALLAASVLLIANRGHRALSLPFAALMLAILLYVSLGGLFASWTDNEQEIGKYVVTYGATIALIWSIAGYVASLSAEATLRFLAFTRGAFVISALAIYASPLLETLYPTAASTGQRFSGLFSNPNEAAYAAFCAVIFVHFVPFRSRVLQLSVLLTTYVAVLLPLSKGAALLLMMFLSFLILRRTSGPRLILLLTISGFIAVGIVRAEELLLAVTQQEVLPLSSSQQARVLAIAQILDGQFDAGVTTGRTTLWEIAIQRIVENFPLASGLGEFHHMEGGILEAQVWQGAHNTFLMIVGEAGLLPATFLAISIVTALARSRRLTEKTQLLATGLLALLLWTAMSSHTMLEVRFQNLALAIVLGLVSLAPSHRRRSRTRHEQPRRQQ